jgi:hypothetical protein
MSKVYDALMRAQRLGGAGGETRSLRDRLRRWLPGAEPQPAESPQAGPGPPTVAPALPAKAEGSPTRELEEKLASLQVSVHALEDRLSAEVVEREAKLLEELRRGMRGLETELSDRFTAATLELKRSQQRGVALVVGFVAALAGLVVALLSLR